MSGVLKQPQCDKCGGRLKSSSGSSTCYSCRTGVPRRPGPQTRAKLAKTGRPAPSQRVAPPPPVVAARKVDVPAGIRAVVARRRESPPATTDAVTRFKVVADALGFDGASMLERAAQAWLDALCASADRSLSVGSSPPRSPRPAPVRLREERAADDRPTAAAAGAGA